MKPVMKSLHVFFGLACLASEALALNGTFKATETWSVTLTYSSFGPQHYTGTKHFSGTQTGTVVIQNGQYTALDQSGVAWSSGGMDFKSRSCDSSSSGYTISGSYVFTPAYGSTAKGIVFLGCFVVSVPLIDGEVPVFWDFDEYSGSGSSLSAITGGGDMIGEELTAMVSSTVSLQGVVGPPTIIQQPQSQTVYAGDNVTFTVVAGGDPPLSYAWRKGSAALPGRTDATLTLTNVQSSNTGSYSVVVGNAGGKVPSAAANLKVQAAPPAWVEGFDSSPLGSHVPSRNTIFIPGDTGKWGIGDTISNDPENCGPDLNHVDITITNGRKLVLLVSASPDSGCAQNVWIAADSRFNSSFPIPMGRGSQISFFEQGWMSDPQWNGMFECIGPPCGDTVCLKLTDNLKNELVYVFQRAPNYIEHVLTNGPAGSGYREIFLDPAGGTFNRSLYGDLAGFAGPAGPGKSIQDIEFSIENNGWAILDDLRIGAPGNNNDTLRPAVSITSPTANQRWSNAVFTVRGTAKDNVRVANVLCWLNGVAAPTLTTNGWTNWTAVVTLSPGKNRAEACAVDGAGNWSLTNSVTFTNVVCDHLTLITTGKGSITPNYSNALLEVGTIQQMTATAASGYLFSNWVGAAGRVLTNGRTLRFVMQSNLVLTANFIPNAFIPMAGTYQGLFYNTGGVEQASSGFFSATVNTNGVFSAKFQQGLQSYSLSGQFSPSGAWYTNAIKNWSNTAAWLQLDLAGGDAITGNLSNARWTASLWANRAIYSKAKPAPQAGKYTLVLPGSANAQSEPGGDGYGSVSVDANGNVLFNGTLGEGTKVTQSGMVLKGAQWAFYIPLYSGQGSLLGWLTFSNQPNSDLEGLLNWIKPAQVGSSLYSSGFTNQTDAVGSRYLFTNGVRALNLTNGVLTLEGGNLSASLASEFTLRPNNTAVGSNGLSLTITNATGLFAGSLTNPRTGKIIKVNGAVLQKMNTACGIFLGTNQSGSVRLGSL